MDRPPGDDSRLIALAEIIGHLEGSLISIDLRLKLLTTDVLDPNINRGLQEQIADALAKVDVMMMDAKWKHCTEQEFDI